LSDFTKNPYFVLKRRQGCHIRREFTQWVVAYFGTSWPHFSASFFHGDGYALISTKKGLDTFWAIFSQTHQVTQGCQMIYFQTQNPNLG
jgi:hypothetical protein